MSRRQLALRAMLVVITIVLVTAIALPRSSMQAQSLACSVDYTRQNDWGSGFTANVVITNNGSSAINGWTLTWTFPGNQQIVHLWNGSYTQSGASVSVSNAGWNGTIGANGGTASFGFNANYSGTNSDPTSFALNGVTCNGGTVPTSVPPTSVPPTSVPPTGVPPTSVPPTSVPPTTVPGGPYQAEDATLGGDVSVDSNHSGYYGSGFVNYPSSGGYVEYRNVDGGTGGSRTLRFRHALGATGARTGQLTVNGSNQNITFQPTGSWDAWAVLDVAANLNAGTNNTIRLSSTGQDLANQDQMEVLSGVTPTTIPPTSVPPTSIPPTSVPPQGRRQMEALDRGVVRVTTGSGNLVSWRLFGTDPSNIGFNVYRGSTRLNSSPITNSTNYLDSGGSSSSSYTVRPVINGQEQAASEASINMSGNYLSVPLQIPSGGTTPDGVSYTYSANDASVGDLDGDGQYEIVLKWDPSNAKDNSQSGYTGKVYLDAYKLNGTRLWRIDLGWNIRAGAHYTQFLVYDFDGDGSAEVACKTADGTRDGQGNVIGSASADYRNSSGYILDGPEYLTVFDGETGRALDTENYIPPRGNVSDWGDSYGNRVDRFLATVAYLDGERPSLVMARGYYTRTVLAAWNFRNGQLSHIWTFDTDNGYSSYAGQGNHNLSAGDSDNDGYDEIMYGSMAVDHNGRGMWNSGLGHGDAMHFSDLVPSRSGLEVWGIHENADIGSALLDARTGAIVWHTGAGDVGRGVAADITASSAGAECWGGTSGLTNCANGANVGSTPSSSNHVVWWDGDLLRELLDGTSITKYGGGTLLSASGCSSNNGTKSNPSLQVDIFGDWREEVIWRTSDSSALRIYATTNTTSYRIYTLMHDPIYRIGISWQNVAYNQPPHTGFFLGSGMSTPPVPDIYLR
ncbi:MAG: cellulose binding domain-containing protein [Anaerolineae bacterium]|nr:cellulose binding domain-containing protein [Anaerolineae bacterium]